MDIDDIKPGVLVKVPRREGRGAPYLLFVGTVKAYASGAVCVDGEMRKLDGSPSGRRSAWRTITTYPGRLEVATVPVAAVVPSLFGIGHVLRASGFRQSLRRPGQRDVFGEGFHLEQDGPAAVNVKWWPPPDTAANLAATRAWLTQYAEAIQAAGWHVEMGRHDLTVTAQDG